MLGVAGNLIAYTDKDSFQHGFGGYLVFTAKTNLIDHYIKTLSAQHSSRNQLVIPFKSAKILVEKYF
jgi:hypothetical protein